MFPGVPANRLVQVATMSDFILHLGDCLDPVMGLASLADKSVDHVITDPPYSDEVHRKLGREGRNDGHDVRLPLTFASLDQVTVSGVVTHIGRAAKRWVLIFSDEYTFTRWRVSLEIEKCSYVRAGAWIKNDPMPQMSGDRPAPGWEQIVISHAPRESGRMKWNGGGKSAVWRSNVCNERGRTENRHPAQKPIELLEALVRDFTDPGETILDPFAGSGTTGVAAIRMGRKFIGWEKDPKYHAIALRRLQNAREQLSMFGGAA